MGAVDAEVEEEKGKVEKDHSDDIMVQKKRMTIISHRERGAFFVFFSSKFYMMNRRWERVASV